MNERIKEMHKIIKPIKGKDFLIVHQDVTEQDVKMMQLRDAINGRREYFGFESGTYVQLRDNCNEIVMSNTAMEVNTNRNIIRCANGDVLIAGLGIGMILLVLQEKENIKSITVIEKYQEVIDLVAHQLPLNEKVKIIQGNIFNWKTKQLFDTIYFDIWTHISADNYDDMKKLHRKFARRLNRENKNCYIDSWRKEDCKRLNK